MPLYEYRCRECERTFEEFVTGNPRIECPGCRSRSVQKLLSVFAVSSGGRDSHASEGGPGACGSCGDSRGPGACRID